MLVTDEYAGRDKAAGRLDPLADAVVSAGNANEVIVLPPMKGVTAIPRPLTS